jgi:hypothetical protein
MNIVLENGLKINIHLFDYKNLAKPKKLAYLKSINIKYHVLIAIFQQNEKN